MGQDVEERGEAGGEALRRAVFARLQQLGVPAPVLAGVWLRAVMAAITGWSWAPAAARLVPRSQIKTDNLAPSA